MPLAVPVQLLGLTYPGILVLVLSFCATNHEGTSFIPGHRQVHFNKGEIQEHPCTWTHEHRRHTLKEPRLVEINSESSPLQHATGNYVVVSARKTSYSHFWGCWTFISQSITNSGTSFKRWARLPVFRCPNSQDFLVPQFAGCKMVLPLLHHSYFSSFKLNTG